MALLVTALGAYGVFLVYTAVAFGWRGAGLGPRVRPWPERACSMLRCLKSPR